MVDEADIEAASDMNIFLQRRALEQMKKNISFTYILRDDQNSEPHRVLAYYCTSVGQLKPEDLPNVVSPRMTIPVFVLLRLAVDRQFQGKGYGSKLFVHILRQAVDLSSQIGLYAVVLEPLNEHLRAFYEKFGLLSLTDDPDRMYIRIRDVESWMSKLGN